MGEIGSIVLVYCETEPAFKGSDMVLEEVWIFVEVLFQRVSLQKDVMGFEVIIYNGFEREFAKSFSAVGIGCGV